MSEQFILSLRAAPPTHVFETLNRLSTLARGYKEALSPGAAIQAAVAQISGGNNTTSHCTLLFLD